jgi:uncharacterized membrane protein YdjX (TVP38/TMEM64 family)
MTPPAVPPPVPEPPRRPGRPAWLLGLGLAALLLLVHFTPVSAYLRQAQQVQQDLHRFGWLAPGVFTGGVALLVAAGLPRLAFCFIGGLTFGFFRGLWWTQLGTFLGCYLAFLAIRSSWFSRLLPARRWGASSPLLQAHGLAAVILARQLPVPALAVNAGLALSGVGHLDFILGTILGQLPQAIPCVMIGSGLLQASWRQSLGLVALGVVLLAGAWLGLRWLLRARLPLSPGGGPPPAG